MAIAPAQLEGVATDRFPTDQIKGLGAYLGIGPHDSTKSIGLSLAGGTGARATQGFEGEVAFLAIAPSQGQFVAHHGCVLERKGVHAPKVLPSFQLSSFTCGPDGTGDDPALDDFQITRGDFDADGSFFERRMFPASSDEEEALLRFARDDAFVFEGLFAVGERVGDRFIGSIVAPGAALFENRFHVTGEVDLAFGFSLHEGAQDWFVVDAGLGISRLPAGS